jgi:membrane protein insertase Oxa1/YidC/SpoIIIJ
MPFLFALYYVLMFSVDLRMAPFVAWIDDLSAPDTIGSISGFQIHVLPLVMTVVSVLQARSTPKDPRQAAMTQIMPVMFLFLFYNMPSGLVLYWTVMNAMAWIQQAMMNRGDGAVATAAVKGTQIAPAASAAGEHGGTGTARDGNGKASSRPRPADAGAASGTDGRGEDGGRSLTVTGGGSSGRQGKPQKRRKRR